ncbi:hypothetical protein D3C84_818730 [compost metagenome]
MFLAERTAHEPASLNLMLLQKRIMVQRRSRMRGADREFDAARRVQSIEWLKTEIVDHVSRLFKSLLGGSVPKLTDSLLEEHIRKR